MWSELGTGTGTGQSQHSTEEQRDDYCSSELYTNIHISRPDTFLLVTPLSFQHKHSDIYEHTHIMHTHLHYTHAFGTP